MSLRCLTQLYTPAGLLLDADGDGLPDGLNVRFHVGRNPGAIDVAARLGLESAAFTPGFTAADADGIPVWFEGGDTGLVAITERGLVVDGWMAARWLAETFPFASPGGPLLADLAQGRPVQSVVVRDGAVVDVHFGDGAVSVADKPTVCGPASEPAFTATAPGDLPPPGLARLFTVAGLMGSSDTVRHDRAGWQVAVTPELTPDELAALCELAARTGVEATGLAFPLAVDVLSGEQVVVLADQPPVGCEWAEDGLAWAPGCLTAFGTPAQRAEALRRAAAQAGLVEGLHATLFTRRAALPEEPLPPGEVIFDLALSQEWEVDRFRRAWAEQVLPRLQAGAPVTVDLRLSEPLPVREVLAEEIAASLAGTGVPEARIRVLSAYKQGFHWLEEEVLPQLQALAGVARVHVTCAPFAASAGAAPAEGLGAGVAPRSVAPGALRGTEGATRSGEPLEMIIRWLQELYPADELLSAALGGATVRFDLADKPQPAIYQVTAYGAEGEALYTDSFTPVHAARLYMPEFPLRGRVHPPTGLLRVEQAGVTIAEIAIDTDAEAFWTAWQEQVLPRLRAYVLEAHGPEPGAGAQPFFGSLVVELAMSEENRRLGIREEQISPLDAMHEDLYFYTLDYLNELGLQLTGKPWPAPGAVEPWVRAAGAGGGPVARVRLHAARPQAAGAAVADALPQAAAPGLPAPAPAIPLDQPIGPDQLPPYLSYLATIPGIRVWRTGLSFAGRATWALSVTAPTAGRIAPPQKLSAWRPTLLVNARRHANELSSTNSILTLAEQAARQGSISRVNLVLSPMENADGAAIHHAMQAEQPHWKLHAARFNAAGVDFGFDCFEPEPRFGESRTLPTLWRACQPDVLLDDHGYPSHEWVQPFSGYNSAPYFRTSWWMPNALIYGIHRWMDAERFPANGAVQEGLRAALAARLTANPEIESYTRTLLDRYVTYGQRYVPEKFPLQLQDGFISLTGKVAAGPEARSFVGRFPHITAAEVITEVPDETAQGDYLALCARAHLEGDLAVLEYLAGRPQPVVRRRWTDGQKVCWSVGRERPFRA